MKSSTARMSGVRAAVEASSRAAEELIGLVAPRLGRATVEKIAINAVMAGCRPEYLPAVIAGVEAICDPAFALVGISGTTDAVAPLLILNGPVRRALEVNCAAGVFGPGWRAHPTLRPALRPGWATLREFVWERTRAEVDGVRAPKFREPTNIKIVVAGGTAGRFSAWIPGWPFPGAPSSLVLKPIA